MLPIVFTQLSFHFIVSNSLSQMCFIFVKFRYMVEVLLAVVFKSQSSDFEYPSSSI